MSHLTSNPPSAKATLQNLKAELTRKVLKSALDSLPPISAINISPQNFSPSEHPFKLHLGSKHSAPAYATLGPRPCNPSHAPDLLFFHGSTSTSMAQLPSFHSLETVNLVEPFCTFWEKSRDMVGARGRKDERRGQFKGLVYWYFLGDAVRRGGGLRVAGTVGVYIGRAVGRLGLGVIDGRRRRRRLGTEDVADVLGEVERFGERQRKVERRVSGDIEEGITAGFRSPTKTSRQPWDGDTRHKGFGEPGREHEIPCGVLRQDGCTRDERLFPYLRRPAKVHDTAHNARHYERHGPRNTYRGTKRKRPLVERDTESEAQFTDYQSSAWESTEEEEQPRTSKRRRHTVYTPSPNYASEPTHSFQDRDRTTQSYQPPRSKKRPDRYKTSQHVRRSITRLKTGPLAWDERLGRHTPLLNNNEKDRPSKSPADTTLPKADSSPTGSPPRPSNIDPEFSSAQYISSMKKALVEMEELDADFASIEEEERRLRIEKDDLAARRKKARDALQDNHAAIQYIAEGIARGRRGEKCT